MSVSNIIVYTCMLDKGHHITLQNKDIKQLLIDHYGNKIQFAHTCSNAIELVYSQAIHYSDLETKIKNQDILHEAGYISRGTLQQIKFGLWDKFCDARDVRNSWKATSMPDKIE